LADPAAQSREDTQANTKEELALAKTEDNLELLKTEDDFELVNTKEKISTKTKDLANTCFSSILLISEPGFAACIVCWILSKHHAYFPRNCFHS
jgi:hypothetical protein